MHSRLLSGESSGMLPKCSAIKGIVKGITASEFSAAEAAMRERPFR